MVIFVKHLTVHFQFHENKPLELGELSTYSAPRSAVTALLLSWRRGRNQNLLYMKVQSIRRPIINSKVKKASLSIHYTVHCGCFGLLDTDNIINQLQSLGRSVIATIKLLAKSFYYFYMLIFYDILDFSLIIHNPGLFFLWCSMWNYQSIPKHL